MQVTYATEAGTPGKPNEDYALTGPDWAVLLDGATAPEGVDSGCIHDVPWLVRHLATAITQFLTLADMPLPEVLAQAICLTCEAHENTCDLSNPDSPSSTAAIIRQRGDVLDYLVLGDTDVILRQGSELRIVHDGRSAQLPGGRPYSLSLVRECRNQPGGFWVASTNPRAAYLALAGSAEDVGDAAMLTDGVTRLVDWYGYDKARLFGVLVHQGPRELIRRVREEEDGRGVPYGKLHDDATAILAGSLLRAVSEPLVADPALRP
jgi:hypothetical protein